MQYYCSDCHQMKYVWKARREIAGDSYEAWDALVETIIEDSKKQPEDEQHALIIAGDFYDSTKVDAETLIRTHAGFQKLVDAGFGIYMIAGNHDKGAYSHTDVIPGVYNLDESSVKVGDRQIYGLKWRPSYEYKQAIKAAPECDVLVLHAKSQHLAGNFQSDSNIFMDEDIPPQVKNVVCGDIHTVDKQPFIGGRGYYVSPGALHPCDLSQGGDHGCWKISNTGPIEWEFLKIPTRQIYRLQVFCDSTLENVRGILDRLNDPMKALVEIIYKVGYGDEVKNLEDAYKEKAFFWLKPSKAGSVMSKEEYLKMQDEETDMDMKNHASTVIDPNKDPEAYELLMVCLGGNTEHIQEKLDELKEMHQ